MRVQVAVVKQDDNILVRMAKQGDVEAFGELVRRHRPKCLARAIRLLRSLDDAEDEVQNAFSKAFEHIHQYQGNAEFSAWLLRIVSNQCLMLIRNRGRAHFVYVDEVSDRDKSVPMELPDSGPDPEGEMACEEMRDVLRTEIRHVPPLFRKVMILRDIQELTMSEVATDLGITVAAAKSRLLRARIELRLRLQRHFDGMGNSSPLSRTAAPLSRLAHRGAI
jgi:RNA polymerase sigma-70 factor, ECF subfamily